MSKENATRLGVLAIAAFAIVVAWKTNVHRPLPSVALRSPFMLRIEHGIVAFAALFFALVVFVKGVWEGELPSKISREGAEYPVAAVADKAQTGITRLTRLSNRRWDMLQTLALRQQRRLDDLAQRLEPSNRDAAPTKDHPS